MRCACAPAFPIVQQGERRVGINNSESKCSASPGFTIRRRIFLVLPQDSKVVPHLAAPGSLDFPRADVDVAHKSIICKWPCFARSKHRPHTPPLSPSTTAFDFQWVRQRLLICYSSHSVPRGTMSPLRFCPASDSLFFDYWSLRRGHDKAVEDLIWEPNSIFVENLPPR